MIMLFATVFPEMRVRLSDLHTPETGAEGKRKHTEQETNMFIKQANIPDTLPLLPVKDAVLFPNMVIPILVKTESYVSMIEEVMEKDRLVVVAMMGDDNIEALIDPCLRLSHHRAARV